MEHRQETLNFSVKPIAYEKLNTQLTKCRCYVLATGPNLNNTNITEEAVRAAIPSLYNIPVVAHLKKKEDGSGWYVGGHDSKLTITDDSICLEDQTVPFGFVPESCNPEFVSVQEPDGITTNTYLIADIILWTGRYNILDAKYSDDVYFNQSCEIEIVQGSYEEHKPVFRIDGFSFSALCLLGKSDEQEYDTRPCFPSCRVERKGAYSLDSEKFKADFALLKDEIRKYTQESRAPNEEVPGTMIDKLITKLAQYKYKNQYGEDVYRYTYIDHNKESVSVLDHAEDNAVYSFKYSLVEDTVDVDFESKTEHCFTTRKKNDAESRFNLNAEIQSAVTSALNYAESAAVGSVTQQLNDVVGQLDVSKKRVKELEHSLEVYEKEKREAENRAIQAEREKVFEKYNKSLANNPEYLIFKSSANRLAPEEIEKECLLIAGKQYTSNSCKFSLNSPVYNPVVTSVAPEQADFHAGNSRYGNLLENI